MKTRYFILSASLILACSLVNAQVNMSNTTTTVNTSVLFYDNSGGSANYGHNLNLTQVFTTTTPNYRIKCNFASLYTLNVNDSLTVYNGATASPANFMGKYTGNGGTPVHYATGNAMTFRFVSDAGGNAAGWVSTISAFGIASITQTTSPQSASTTFTINGSNTDFNLGISDISLVHSVASFSISAATYTAISATQLKATFNIPCNANLGLYHLRVNQPTIGLSEMPNAFQVTSYSVSLTGTNILCAYMNTGVITPSVTGGSPPYSYLYTPAAITTPTASGLMAGTYTLTLTDGNSCVRSQTISLTEPPPLSNGYPNSQTICSGQSATLTMVGSGGVGGYTYSWTGPNLSSNTTASTIASPLSSTTYNFSVMDANGCTNTSTLTISVNPLPTLTVSPSSTMLCPGGSSTLTASGSATTYSWNTGATSSSILITPAGTTVYSVTGTNANGCSKTGTVSVTVNPNPVVSATAATPVCLGGNLTFVNNSTGAGIYSWSGPSSYASTVANPVIANISYAQAGTYTLTGMNAATGCSASNTLAVTVNASPSLTLAAGSSSLCAGSTFTANSSGALSYTWMPGASTGASQTFTPSASTIYTVTGTDAIGCAGSKTLAITVNPLTTISGTATASANPVAGKVTLYAYEPFLTKFDSITTQATSGTGAYTFTAVPAGSYIVKAIPTASTLQVTYGNSAISWQNAAVINHTCINSSAQNINVMPFTAITAGAGLLSGRITEGQGFGQRAASPYSPLAPGNPIGGIIVKGGKNPGGNMFSQTVTGSNGTYTLSGLPLNTGEDFFVMVDIPGLDTNGTYHRFIVTGNSQYTNLDFVVDSANVNPVPSTTGIHTPEEAAHQISLYPNPAKHQLTVRYTLTESAVVSIALFDLLGHCVQSIAESGKQEAGTHAPVLNISELKAGIYLSRIRINNFETNTRIFITD